MVTISFPGFGIDEFTINKVIFSIKDYEYRWYTLILTCGIFLALLYCYYRSKHEGFSVDDLLDLALFGIPCAIIGARLYYVLTDFSNGGYDTFLDVIAIWEGGIAIYGAIIAGGLTIFLVCRHKKKNPLKAFDMVAPAVMLGQIIGRWGNFFNGEAYGAEVPEESILYFARMGLISSNTRHDFGTSQMVYVHPTFLYESLWNLVGFIIINLLYKKKKFDGQVFFMYIAWYGFGRMFIEGLRTDSLYVGVFRISQVVGFICFVVGSILLIYNLVKSRRKALTAMDYAPAYPKFSHTATVASAKESVEESETVEDTENTEDTEETEDTAKLDEEPDFKRYRIKTSDENVDVDSSLKNLFSSEDDENSENPKN